MPDAEIYLGTPPLRLRPLRPGETPAQLAEDVGLSRCPDCGEFRGTCATDEGETRLLCICEGITCRACKTNPIRRPNSNRFNEADGKIWHNPYFMGLYPCAECRMEKR